MRGSCLGSGEGTGLRIPLGAAGSFLPLPAGESILQRLRGVGKSPASELPVLGWGEALPSY